MQGHTAGEPYRVGRLDVGDGHQMYWEECGNPTGKPALAVHGGPGSGCGPSWRQYFDPRAYRVVLFDQRGCGRSTPHVSDPSADLTCNTTHHLIADIERLRRHLGVERWLVLGGSWGSTLGLAYAEAFPERVSELVLFSVALTTQRDVEWLTRDMGRVFPAEWERFRNGVPREDRDGNLALAYACLLNNPDPRVREKAAADWCAWEDAHVSVLPGAGPDPRYADPKFRLAFARLVTHYWAHAAWLEEGALLSHASRLDGIPGTLIHGRLDVSSPLDSAWSLSQVWRGSELVVVDAAGHGAVHEGIRAAVLAAIDRFAPRV